MLHPRLRLLIIVGLHGVLTLSSTDASGVLPPKCNATHTSKDCQGSLTNHDLAFSEQSVDAPGDSVLLHRRAEDTPSNLPANNRLPQRRQRQNANQGPGGDEGESPPEPPAQTRRIETTEPDLAGQSSQSVVGTPLPPPGPSALVPQGTGISTQDPFRTHQGSRSRTQLSRSHSLGSLTGEGTDPLCVICRDPITADKALHTPCSHVFHRKCIYQWAAQGQTQRHSDSCPQCRRYLRDGKTHTDPPTTSLGELKFQPKTAEVHAELVRHDRHAFLLSSAARDDCSVAMQQAKQIADSARAWLLQVQPAVSPTGLEHLRSIERIANSLRISSSKVAWQSNVMQEHVEADVEQHVYSHRTLPVAQGICRMLQNNANVASKIVEFLRMTNYRVNHLMRYPFDTGRSVDRENQLRQIHEQMGEFLPDYNIYAPVPGLSPEHAWYALHTQKASFARHAATDRGIQLRVHAAEGELMRAQNTVRGLSKVTNRRSLYIEQNARQRLHLMFIRLRQLRFVNTHKTRLIHQIQQEPPSSGGFASNIGPQRASVIALNHQKEASCTLLEMIQTDGKHISTLEQCMHNRILCPNNADVDQSAVLLTSIAAGVPQSTVSNDRTYDTVTDALTQQIRRLDPDGHDLPAEWRQPLPPLSVPRPGPPPPPQ